MPRIGGPGQQASPNPIKARPVTRATGIVMSANSSLSSNCPTSDGTISNANPVTISATAVKTSTILITPSLPLSQIAYPLWAGGIYSISSSARPISVLGTLTPSTFVRSGSKADMCGALTYVRFGPRSDILFFHNFQTHLSALGDPANEYRPQ